jgi:molybdopterin converting factor subunit 1
MTMRIRVLLFAHLAEQIGAREVALDLADDARAAEALEAFFAAWPAFAAWRGRLAIARDERYITMETPIEPDDVIALIPPVSGG